MTVRKRLFWSNILMIFCPVIVTVLIGLLCVGIIWIAIINGVGINLHDTEDFNRVSLAITETIEYMLDGEKNLTSLNALLENNGMAANVFYENEEIYTFGNADENDNTLKTAADLLGDNAVVSHNGRSLYKAKEVVNGNAYTIYILGGNHSENTYANLKVALVSSIIVIAFTIFISILMTNRFLTKFVFNRIEKPLDILTNGVHEIRDGNLDFHIDYEHIDEFKPICEDFNDMAIRLKESVAKQHQQEQSRKELIAGISHDIRSPLTSIQAYVEGLLDGIAKTPEAQQRYLVTIKTKAEDLDRIVSQLFLFSKMELGEYPENTQKLKLDEKVAALVAETRLEYAEKGMQIETDLSPVTVNADPIQIERVIANIMENSLKYKTKEKGILKITLKENGNSCYLAFDDNGPGVPDDALPHLFEVFYRSDPARQKPQRGSGLGLAIAESIVTQAGGSIQANKSDLGGLRIEICLPCIKGSADDGKNINC